MAGNDLTERELEILRLLAWPNKEIARLLGLHQGTVRNYITRINKKVRGCSNEMKEHTRVKLLLAALHGGYLRLDEVSAGPILF